MFNDIACCIIFLNKLVEQSTVVVVSGRGRLCVAIISLSRLMAWCSLDGGDGLIAVLNSHQQAPGVQDCIVVRAC